MKNAGFDPELAEPIRQSGRLPNPPEFFGKQMPKRHEGVPMALEHAAKLEIPAPRVVFERLNMKDGPAIDANMAIFLPELLKFPEPSRVFRPPGADAAGRLR
ncbi:MAG: hypothetical protein N2322_03585 [Terrimicrobiaceae bacterium]|nr:hypothetical protein [Terrimicrobiaceae bacterium]